MAGVEIKLSHVDRVYRPGETLSGVIAVTSKGSMSHNGISLHLDGEVTLQLSGKSVGVFEAFYNSLKPIKLLDYKIEVSKSGKLPDGVSELPFEFKLEPLPDQTLYDTYHGVFVSIGYTLTCDILRGVFAKNIQKKMEFVMEVPSLKPVKPTPVEFTMTPEALETVRTYFFHQLTITCKRVIALFSQGASSKIPQFMITGNLRSAVCEINKPFVGELCVKESSSPIRSIELQLVRVETCGCADGYAKEPTEIQNIQICDGDVCRGLTIPIYMIFPRLFTCPSMSARTFKVEFEVNVVVMFCDGHLLLENLPIELVRPMVNSS